jgi:hypothetical protein
MTKKMTSAALFYATVPETAQMTHEAMTRDYEETQHVEKK